MTTAAIIVAAGRGLRAGGGVAKQWRIIAGQEMIAHTIDAFRACAQISRIVLVLHPHDEDRRRGFERLGFIVVLGGETRSESVRNGLISLQNTGTDQVLIHDAARPCVQHQLINAVIAALASADAAAPALAVTDALWVGRRTGDTAHVTGTKDREGLFRAQTPQGFRYDAICAAYAAHPGEAADDVAVARAFGLDVVIVAGDADNLKVTLPGDFARAERILGNGMDIRLGNGFDVHRFGPGDQVTLCGVQVPHDRGLQGHSDADVGMHAVTDAIYGALAQGDIGQHFPPSDPQWKGAASDIFLSHAAGLAREMGYRISNVDCTLICEFPKIGPHAAVMRAALAKVLGLEIDRVSVKATTSERLGFTGRGEGIAAMATATLVQS